MDLLCNFVFLFYLSLLITFQNRLIIFRQAFISSAPILIVNQGGSLICYHPLGF
jgi:hypothetical protein